jgi:predicted MPP superfamily phosphohydrolase
MILIYILSGAILLGLAVLAVIYAVRFETVNFNLSYKRICLSEDQRSLHSSEGFPALKILHLSDFHLRKDRKGRALYDFIQGLYGIEADLIFITGDMVEKDDMFDHLVKMLEGFKAKHGTYAVFGAMTITTRGPRNS